MPGVERFAYAVARTEDLVPEIGSALRAALLPGEVARQIVFAPRQVLHPTRGGLRNWLGGWFFSQDTPAWVLLLTDERLLLATIAEASAPPLVTITPLANVLWLELGTILLYSWFEWSWVDAGRPLQQRVYFNTVRDDLFWGMADAMRRTIITQAGRPQPAGKRPYEAFESLPYKFRNIIPLRLMLPGEQVQAMVFQPSIWVRRWLLFRHQRAPTTAVVLSPDHLLVAQEDITLSRPAYGLIARYGPRTCLQGATLEQSQGDLWLNVTLGLHEAEHSIRLLFEPSAGPALQTLIGAMSQDGIPL